MNHLVRQAWLLVLAAGIATSIGAYAWLSDRDAQSIQVEIAHRSQVKLDAIRAIFQQHFDTAMAIRAFVQGETGAHQYVDEIEVQGFAHAMLDTHPDELVAIAIIPPPDSGEAQFVRRDGEGRLDPSLDRQRLYGLAPADVPDIQLLQNRERYWLTRLSTSVVSESGTGYAISDWNTTAMIDIAITGTPGAGLDVEVGLIKNGQFTGIYRHRSRLRETEEAEEAEVEWRGGFSLNGSNFEVRTRALPSVFRQFIFTDPIWMLLLGLALSLLLAYLAYNRSRYGERLRLDVAERTREVEGEQQKLASVIDHANEVVLLMDEQGRILRANPAASDLFGYAPDEWANLSVHDLVPEDIRKPHVQWFAGEMAGKRHDIMGRRRELTARRKDGSIFHCEVTVNEFLAAKGRRLSVIMRDLTEQKQYEWSREVLLRLRTVSQHEDALTERLQQMLDCIFTPDPWGFMAGSGAIFLVEGETLRLAVSHGWSEENRAQCETVQFGECLCGRAIASGGAVFHMHRPDEHRLAARGGTDAGYLCASIMHAGERLGLINLKLKPAIAMPDAFRDFCHQAEEIIAEMLVRTRAREALKESEYKYRSLVESTNAAAWQLDFVSGQFTYMGPQIEKLTGYPAGNWKDFDFWAERIHPEDRELAVQYCKTSSERGENHDFEYRVVTSDGNTVWIRDVVSVISGEHGQKQLIGYMFDVSGRKETEEKLTWMSYYDELTDLPNRRLFTDRVGQATAVCRREQRSLALLYLDIDRFKFINDTLGHSIGDKVLQEVAVRIQQSLRETDTVARMGGDEFTVLLPGADVNTAMRVARKLGGALQRSLLMGEQNLALAASIGIAVFPNDGKNGEELLKHADIAMYHAKTNQLHIHCFSSSMEEQAVRRLRMEQDLARAVDGKQLELYYQGKHALGDRLEASPFPLHYQAKHRLDDDNIFGVEALIRWNHPELGMVSPAEFIPLAEESGLIHSITRWALAEAGYQAIAWEKACMRPGRIGVNISAIQLMQKGLAKEILARIREAGAKPEWIEIEITETAVMREPEIAITIMRELAEAGISIAIDDFGTGYSSLAYLKRLPAEWLKIDMAFIRNLPDDEEDSVIVRSTIAMAHALGMKVIAEGVEKEAQLEFLRNEGCDAVQGYLFSKPLPAARASAYIRNYLKS